MSAPRKQGMPFDVMVAGPVYCDLIFSGLEDLPHFGTELFAPHLLMTAGGSAITAVALSRLGNAVTLVADVGGDLAGETVAALLAVEGVDTGRLSVHRGATTPITAVLSTKNDRAFVTHLPSYPAASSITSALAGSEARHLHVGGFPLALEQPGALSLASSHSMTTSFDPGWHESSLRAPEVVNYALTADIFMPSLLEAQVIVAEPLASAAQAASALAALRDGRLSIVKDGARGAAAAQDGNVVTALPPAVDVVDTTGAGDVFDAVFLGSWLAKRPLQECLRRAVIGGAMAVTARGGFSGAPYEEDLGSG